MTETGSGQRRQQTEQAAAAQQEKMSQADVAVKQWHFIVEPDGVSAADFLNIPTAQVAGEAFAISLPDGQVGLFFFL
jgi:hypothetical protein